MVGSSPPDDMASRSARLMIRVHSASLTSLLTTALAPVPSQKMLPSAPRSNRTVWPSGGDVEALARRPSVAESSDMECPLMRLLFETALHGAEQIVLVERLGQNLGGPQRLHQAQIIAARAVPAARHRDDGQSRIVLADLADGLDAFLHRHDDVGDDEVEFPFLEEAQPLFAVSGADHAEAAALEHALDGKCNQRVVIDKKDRRHASSRRYRPGIAPVPMRLYGMLLMSRRKIKPPIGETAPSRRPSP